MKRFLVPALVAGLLLCACAPAFAAVNVNRHGDENPMVEIARSTMYGALAGTLVGGALALASDAHDGSAVKWGFVVGTFVGAGYGFYSVSTRPQPSALLEWRGGRLASGGFAAIEAEPGTARVRLAAVRF
jgi:hypothetical protein